MRRAIRGVALFVLIVALSARADAAIIDFTSFSMGPTGNGVLEIGDVTVTGLDPFTVLPSGVQPGIVAGVGLGLSTFASSGRIDRSVVKPGGPQATSQIDGMIDIRVNGTINAITVQPYFTVTGGPPADPDQVIELNLNMSPFLNVDGYWIINAFTPHTFGIPPSVDAVRLGLRTDFGPDPWLSMYYSKYGFPDGFQWGYAVTSIDYTPTDVPEPATIGLLGVALAWMRRRRASRTS
jgi:hypothetical protein